MFGALQPIVLQTPAIYRPGRALALATIFHLVASAHAASLSTVTLKDGKVTVHLSGEILLGDADELTKIIKLANDGGRIVSGIRLNSPGGNISEAAKLAEIIRYGKIGTVVAAGATCASACFVIFAGGTSKYASYSASVGVHGASDAEGRETIEAGGATVLMARALKELGVPEAILGKMVVTPPSSMVWLTPDDLRSIGTTMTGKPSQTPSEPPTGQVPNQLPSAAQAPVQLDPSNNATLSSQIPQSSKKSWDELVKGASAFSRQQNGGSIQANRACQPELRICTMAIFFNDDDGSRMMIRRTENADGKLISRDVCSFNKFKDVRTCVDYDSGKATREMQNERKEWVVIED
jgi:hypothetical protein